MIILSRFCSVLLLLSLIFPFSSSAFAFGSSKGVGTVKVKSSPVWVVRKGKKLNISGFGLKLQKDDLVKTADGGQAEITLGNGDKIYVAPLTEIQITEDLISPEQSGVTQLVKLFFGKIRAKIQKTKKKRTAISTTTATIGVKGTDFVTAYIDDVTQVGTMEGLVSLTSQKTKASVDIPPGRMASVSPVGELLPLEEFAGELMEGVEFAGAKMESQDISGEKIEL